LNESAQSVGHPPLFLNDTRYAIASHGLEEDL
jgi:hypothetical protein